MSEPVLVGKLLPGVVAEAIARAGPGYDRWMEQVAATGYCAHPVRLRGRVEHADPQTGEVRTVYSTDREPDATLLKGCGNRRVSVCPSCSATYQADQFQLLAAGLRGGKGVPETVAGHPRLFVTFTAPSFGPASTAARRKGGWCSPAIPTGRASGARMAGGWAAGSATTRTIRGWASRCVPGATRLERRCCGTPWLGGCGRGPPSMSIGRWPSSPA
jgi:hypothetical protein